MQEYDPLTPLTSQHFSSAGAEISHGFFTRRGGVSDGIYQSLNVGLGSGDEGDAVNINRQRVAENLGTKDNRLVTVSQVHSPDVVAVEGPWSDERPRADGIVTKTPGVAIGILTADCGPVLFADKDAGVIGAAHAGWKGAMYGVLENTIDAMINLGAQRDSIVAMLGPCISQKNYEVGPEYYSRFVEADKSNSQYFVNSEKDDHHMFDLASYIVDRLNGAGVAGDMLGVCTYQEESQFYSYRRSVHKEEPDYGRQVSAIMLR